VTGTDRWLGSAQGRRFYAKVVSVDDPQEQGRVQIRVFGMHDDVVRIPDKDLPWAVPIVPITHGASLRGVGQAPVGVVPGTVVTGHIIDGDHTIFQVEGSLVSAGQTKRGQIVDGSYAIDQNSNDLPHSSRGQDLNAALGLTNLIARSLSGAQFRSLTAGIGYLPTAVSVIESMSRIDPHNTSGMFAKAVTSLAAITAVSSFASRLGATNTAAQSIQRALATAIGLFGLTNTLAVVNGMDRSRMSPDALYATNSAMSNLAYVGKRGGTSSIISESLPLMFVTASMYGMVQPGMKRGPLGNAAALSNSVLVGAARSGYSSSQLRETAQFLNTLSGINNIVQMANLGGIQGIMAVAGGTAFATSLLVDLVSDNLIGSMQSSFTSGSMALALNDAVDSSHLGGMNMTYGLPIKAVSEVASLSSNLIDSATSYLFKNGQDALSEITSDIDIGSISDTYNTATAQLATLQRNMTQGLAAADPILPNLPVEVDATSSTAAVDAPPAIKFVAEVGTAAADTFEEVRADISAEIESQARDINLEVTDSEQETLITEELTRRRRDSENV
jgi:hypothetical protein